ncbi:uncharacterized protein LOC134222478 [Armigeres subalbatus]|uniref:uncharacterized protein LOC134222478 n=1 Tax=Armigeres subalbatus TaxID=124917 RepID=UPI002ED3EF12
MHDRLLHDDKRYSKPTTATESAKPTIEMAATQSCNTHTKTARKVLFRYVPVTIYGKGKQVSTYAFLDDGSSSTLMEHSLLKELGLKGTPYPLCLDWTGGHKRHENESVMLALKISGVSDTNDVFELSEVHTVRDLSLPKQSVSISQLATNMDNCRLGHASRSIEGSENEPVASKTRLGWMVYGPCSIESGTIISSNSGHHSFHICACVNEEDKDLNAAMKEYFSIESLGVSAASKSLPSKDEERAMQILSTETRLIGNRYETGLLWRYDQIMLPCNRGMAMNRLACLQKRLRRDPELAVAMQAKMSEYERLVSLLTVLYKFREFRVAIVGDIREMFFQVQMKKQDQRSQMILWHNGEPEIEPEVYAVAVMTFGAACSPSCAHYVKNLNGKRFEKQYPRAVECIKYEHYVDDMLASLETEQEAVKLAKEVRFIHS